MGSKQPKKNPVRPKVRPPKNWELMRAARKLDKEDDRAEKWLPIIEKIELKINRIDDTLCLLFPEYAKQREANESSK